MQSKIFDEICCIGSICCMGHLLHWWVGSHCHLGKLMCLLCGINLLHASPPLLIWNGYICCVSDLFALMTASSPYANLNCNEAWLSEHKMTHLQLIASVPATNHSQHSTCMSDLLGSLDLRIGRLIQHSCMSLASTAT